MTRPFHNMCGGVRLAAALVATLGLLSGWLSGPALAASAKEIDAGVDEAIVMFEKEVKDGKSFLANSKGVLVFPSVLKAGLGVGGEYGEGALRIAGKTVDYYSTAAGSVGLQAGGQSQDRLCGVSAGRCPEKVSRKRRMEGGCGRLRRLGHLGSWGCRRYNDA